MNTMNMMKPERTPARFLHGNYFSRVINAHINYHPGPSSRAEIRSQIVHSDSANANTDATLDAAIAELDDEYKRRATYEQRKLERVALYASKYVRKLHDAYTLKPERDLAPELVQAARDPGILKRLPQRVRNVYKLPILTEQKCTAILQELQNFNDACERNGWPRERPNSMNRHGLLLQELGFAQEFLDPLVAIYIKPIAAALFPDCGGDSLDSFRSFTVVYHPAKDDDEQHDSTLAYHFDDSEVTLNVNLGEAGYEGGEVLFGGGKDDGHGHTTRSAVTLGVGEGILHRGSHCHEVATVTEKPRTNLVVWMRSEKVRRKSCPMCGSSTCFE